MKKRFSFLSDLSTIVNRQMTHQMTQRIRGYRFLAGVIPLVIGLTLTPWVLAQEMTPLRILRLDSMSCGYCSPDSLCSLCKLDLPWLKPDSLAVKT